MKSLKLPSMISPNNSVALIFFVFMFIAIGMFFLIKKTTEKQNQEKEDKKNKLIEEKNILNNTDIPMAKSTSQDNTSGDDNNNQHNTVSETFQDEVGLFIKKEESRPEMYSHSPLYIPPFDTGKETRCVTRQMNKPDGTMNVQSCSNSNLVKIASNASY